MNAATKFLFAAPLLLASLVLTACSGLPQGSGSTGGSGSGTGPYTIGGTVTGLTGTGLVLQDNAGDNLTVAAAGAFTFKTSIASGGAYAITVLTQPSTPTQTCTVTGGSGTASANVTSVAVACSTAPVKGTVGGTISGLSGTGLILQNNGGDSLTITANGPFTFKTSVTGTYSVTVLTQPTGPAQICTVANGTGTAVTCVLSFTIGGNVTGVVGTGLILQDNGGDNLTITTNGAFTFKAPLPTGTAYAVTVFAQPASPAQTCVIATGTGSGTAGANVASVVVNCPAVTFRVGGNVVGLLGKQPTPPNNAPLTDSSFQLLNNGGDNKIITQNGPFNFVTPVNINGQYSLSVISFPSTQNEGCTLWNYKGVATANVTSILVDCAHDDWTWIDGGKTAGVYGTPQYGSFPTTPPTTTPNPYTNTPGTREGGAAWTDASGNLWLFGGLGFELSGNVTPDTLSGYLNDLWECPIVSGDDQCQWQLLETPVAGKFPIAQHEDIPTSGSLPGGRFGTGTWTSGGNFFLFGGQGVDSAGHIGLLSDLWQYNSGTWTLVKGSTVRNQQGTYTVRQEISYLEPAGVPFLGPIIPVTSGSSVALATT
jgi:hypothetical protein